MSHVAAQGNTVIREVALPDAASEIAFKPVGGGRSVAMHSRGGFDFRVATEATGTTGGPSPAKSYITITATTYWQVPSDVQSQNFYFRSANAAGDIIEVVVAESLTGIQQGVDVGYKR